MVPKTLPETLVAIGCRIGLPMSLWPIPNPPLAYMPKPEEGPLEWTGVAKPGGADRPGGGPVAVEKPGGAATLLPKPDRGVVGVMADDGPIPAF